MYFLKRCLGNSSLHLKRVKGKNANAWLWLFCCTITYLTLLPHLHCLAFSYVVWFYEVFSSHFQAIVLCPIGHLSKVSFKRAFRWFAFPNGIPFLQKIQGYLRLCTFPRLPVLWSNSGAYVWVNMHGWHCGVRQWFHHAPLQRRLTEHRLSKQRKGSGCMAFHIWGLGLLSSCSCLWAGEGRRFPLLFIACSVVWRTERPSFKTVLTRACVRRNSCWCQMDILSSKWLL